MNKSHKITADIRYENEPNRTIFAILSFFSKELYIKQVFRQQARKHAKTLLKYKGAWQQVALMERAFHKYSKKISLTFLEQWIIN